MQETFEPTEDYPTGGTVEPYDIWRDEHILNSEL